MSWKDNVTSETIYNPTFSSMVPPSSCSSESQFYLDDNLPFTQGDEDFLLTENNVGQRDTKYHLLPQYKYQMSYPSSSSSTIITTPKSLHNSTKSILSDGEEEVKDYELMEKPRSKNNSTISSKREKTLEKNRQGLKTYISLSTILSLIHFLQLLQDVDKKKGMVEPAPNKCKEAIQRKQDT
jgi:hypothetical protein